MRLARHHLHRCGHWARRVTIALILLLAGVEALAQLSLPLLAWQPQWIAYELSRRLHCELKFGSLKGHWHLSGPDFDMQQITIRSKRGGPPLHLGEAKLKIDFGGWMPGRHWINLYGRDLALELIYAADGSWRVAGFGSSYGSRRQSIDLGQIKAGLWFQNLKLEILDQGRGRTFTLIADGLRISKEGQRIRLGARLHRQGGTGFVLGAGWFSSDARRGRLWLAGQDMVLDDIMAGVDLKGYRLESGKGAWAGWLDWQHTHFKSTQLRLDLSQLVLLGPHAQRTVVSRLHGALDILRRNRGFAIQWAGDHGSLLEVILEAQAQQLSAVQVKASDLDLKPLAPWVGQWPELSPALSAWLGQGGIHGWLRYLDLDWQQATGLRRVDLRFDGLGLHAVGKAPGMETLRGELHGNAQSLNLELPEQMTLLRADADAEPVLLQRFGLKAVLQQTQQGRELTLDQLNLAGEGFQIQAQGTLALPTGGAPIADLHFELPQLSIPALQRLWPEAAGKHIGSWMREALQRGEISAQGVLQGNLHAWPFRHGEGRFEINASIDDLGLRYLKHWPAVQDIHGKLTVYANGLKARLDHGLSDDVTVEQAQLRIPSFHDPWLDLRLQGQARTADAVRFITHTPVAEHLADTLGKLKFSGETTVKLRLGVSLKGDKDLTLQGQGRLDKTKLSAPEWKLLVGGINGPFMFNHRGFSAGPLRAKFHGEPAQIQLRIGADTGNPTRTFTALLRGRYRFDQLTQGYDFLDWLSPLGRGQADFVLGFEVRKPHEYAAAQPWLWLNSDLRGIALQVPAPLNKSAATALPLHLELPLPIDGSHLQLKLGDIAQGLLRLPGPGARPLAGSFHLGSGMPAAVPARGLRFTGTVQRFDATGWLGFATAGDGRSKKDLSLDGVDIQAAQAEFFGASFPRTHLKVCPEGSQMHIELAGPAVLGTVDAKTGHQPEVWVNLQRLYWPPAASLSDHLAKPPPTTSRSVDQAVARLSADKVPNTDQADPAKIPPLKIRIDHFRYGAVDLGAVQLASQPLAEGMWIRKLNASGKDIRLDGDGWWLGTAAHQRSRMNLSFAVQNLGTTEVALGYPRWFYGGVVQGKLAASWPGTPVSLDPANMAGDLHLQIDNGRLVELPPGFAARLISLLSINQIPRRLGLHFGDVFNDGFSFNRIAGDLRFAAGNIYTQNLRIRSPPASIKVHGRTGIAARDYDAEVTISPHLSSSLPLVGVIAGGPIGIAAGFLAYELFGHSINDAAIRHYHLAGSWDAPQFLPMSKSSSPQAATTQVPDAAAKSSAL